MHARGAVVSSVGSPVKSLETRVEVEFRYHRTTDEYGEISKGDQERHMEHMIQGNLSGCAGR